MSPKRLWLRLLVAAFLVLGILIPYVVSVSRAEAAAEQPLFSDTASVGDLPSVVYREDGSTALHSMQMVVLDFTVIAYALDTQLSSGALIGSFTNDSATVVSSASANGVTLLNNIISSGDGFGLETTYTITDLALLPALPTPGVAGASLSVIGTTSTNDIG